MVKKLFLVLLLAGIIIIFVEKNPSKKPVSENLNYLKVSNIHPLMFYEKDAFYNGVEKARKANKEFDYKVNGGIIPHHLFPSFIIADFFSRLKKQNPKNIIIVGPNHFERGDSKILTSLYNWETPFGIVEPESKIVSKLINDGYAKQDEVNFPKDHAVAGILPFIKYYLPESKIIPLLLSGFMSENETSKLSQALKAYMDKDTIIISAVDFSHYLNSKQAQDKDELTLTALKNFDYRTIFKLNSDYLDSPSSIALVMMLMQELKTTNMEVLQHTNSGELQRNDNIETTSYFSIAYH